MNLRQRLRLMRPAAPSGSPRPTEAEHPSPAGPSSPRRSVDRRLHLPLPGTPVDTAAGPAWCTEHRYPLDFRRGRMPLGGAARLDPDAWSRWLGRDTDGAFAPQSTAFIDVETTGLERGTGTYALLIGIGRFVDRAFRIRQFFMRDYDEEPAVLEAVLQELEGVRGIITYNGLTFDWPLLQTRATLNRLALPEPVQLDLLYPARRLWKPVTGDCRLGRLEEAILGVTRQGDVPGFLIPQLYFRYLQTGDASPLRGIIDHNRQDILTTAALAGYIGHAIAEPLEAAPLGRPLPGTDLYAIGRLLVERGEGSLAIACLEEALERGLPGRLQGECRRLLAAAYRRAGRSEEAAEQWRRLVETAGFSVEPYVELAKYYEHRAKDLWEARKWTLRAIDVLQRRRLLQRGSFVPERRTFEGGHGARRGAGADAALEELHHRLRRIDAKLARRFQAPAALQRPLDIRAEAR